MNRRKDIHQYLLAFGFGGLILMAVTFHGFMAFLSLDSAKAASITEATYQDTDNDGVVDTILLTFDAIVTACVFEALDWVIIEPSSLNLSITGSSCSGLDNTITLDVTADASITGSSTTPLISYENQGILGSILFGLTPLGTISNIPVNDATNPILTAASFGTTTRSGITYNSLTLTYSEAITLSTDGAGGDQLTTETGSVTSSANLGNSTSARTLEGLVSWGSSHGGDMTTSGATSNTIELDGDGDTVTILFNTDIDSYFASGSTGPSTPAVSIISDVNDLVDAVGLPINTNQSSVTATQSASWDVTVPTVTTTYSCDLDADGSVERFQIDFSESMLDAALSASEFIGDSDLQTNGISESTMDFVSTSTYACDTQVADTDANDNKISVSTTSELEGTEMKYLHIASGSIVRDQAGNLLAVADAVGNEQDYAPPVLLSSTPTDNETDIDVTQDIILTFSEPMDTYFDELREYTISPDPGAFTEIFTSADKVVTISPSSEYACETLYTFTLDLDDTDAASGEVTATSSLGPLDGEVVFTTGDCPVVDTGSSSDDSSTGTTVLTTPEIEVLTSKTSYDADDVVKLQWMSDGSVFDLSYSTDGGNTFTLIESGYTKKLYNWRATVPGDPVLLRIDATDGVEVLTSLFFEVTIENEDGTLPDAVTVLDEEDLLSERPEDEGESAYEGEVEVLAEPEETVLAKKMASLIRIEGFDTVYFLDHDGVRHPVMNEKVYFTWRDDFEGIATIAVDQASLYPLGSPVPPLPGTVLVKITTDPRVYLVTDNPEDPFSSTLRALDTELVAQNLIGEDWADYIIDIDDTLFPRFTFGEVIEHSAAVELNITDLRKRDELTGVTLAKAGKIV
jgi:hypothetical protein